MSDLLTVGQAATLAGVSVRTMRRRVAAGEVMTSGHGQARRIVAASIVTAPPPGDPATGGPIDGTPASVTEVSAAMAEDNAATVTPAVTALVAMVDRLTVDNRELSRQLVDVTAAATLWQERARVLGEQLALAAPSENPVAGQQTPDVPAPTMDAPVPLTARLRALAPWLLLVALLLLALVVGWTGGR